MQKEGAGHDTEASRPCGGALGAVQETPSKVAARPMLSIAAQNVGDAHDRDVTATATRAPGAQVVPSNRMVYPFPSPARQNDSLGHDRLVGANGPAGVWPNW
ncbi:hypothetical protein GCM10027053_47830 [Intrasporangium mesophilum]